MNSNPFRDGLWKFPLVITVVFLVALLTADKVFTYVLSNYHNWKDIFWALAFSWSVFLALYAFQLHTRLYAEDPKDVSIGYGKLRWSQRIHQFTLNFAGGMVGWVIMYLLLYTNHLDSFEGWEKLVLLLIAFIAALGYLPYIVLVKAWLPGRDSL